MSGDREALVSGIDAASLRASWTTGLIVVFLALLCASLASDLAMLDFMHRAQAGGDVTEAEGEALDSRSTTIALSSLAVLAAAGILWMRWLHRACANLRLAGSGASRFTPGWAVGWWFVPIMNIWRPYQVMQDLLRRSAGGNVEGMIPASPSKLVLAWWVLGLVSKAVDRHAMRQLDRTDDIDALVSGFQFSIAGTILSLASGALALLILRRVQQHQRETLAVAPLAVEVAPASA